MAITQVLRGVVKPDGTLELESSPNLPAGPVEVVLRPLPYGGQAGEDWWQYLQRVRDEADAAGGPFRSQQEIESEREDFRSGDERVENGLRQIEGEPSGGKADA